ncbi:DnaJ-domain-containing protein [Dendrothele bispora CBS 962.96]|uniref:DnaJ-domain-containing protein n=1 Tax=Dendrothele bispora (strain CBS 962.96) TaxID=1314807 RepID=A0A4S8LC28_DENBC|nr:DnaJ-domain-containing protein [Dendrothele bispora CBS 962.96]
MEPTLYQVLDIETFATTEEIRHAYKQKALETHPDKLDPAAGEDEKREAKQRFVQVREAFEVLSDPLKRRAYDFRNGITRPPLSRQTTDELSRNVERIMKERQAWAHRQEEMHRRRLEEIRERLRKAREEAETASVQQETSTMPTEEPITDVPTTVPEPIPPLVLDGIFIDFKLKPDIEWERRRQIVQQRRAERISPTMRQEVVQP